MQSRRILWRIGGLVLSLILFSRGLFAAQPPNIVLIISDDQAWTDYGFMGHPVIQTPLQPHLFSFSYKKSSTPGIQPAIGITTIEEGTFGKKGNWNDLLC